jgi:L-alanine-DL-glutamate epimerase-like enolase superfamily enzyme
MNTMGASGMVMVTTMGVGSTPAEEGTDMAAELGWGVATAVPGMAAGMAAVTAAATVNILVPGEKESADLQNITAGRTRTAAINRESVHGCA